LTCIGTRVAGVCNQQHAGSVLGYLDHASHQTKSIQHRLTFKNAVGTATVNEYFLPTWIGRYAEQFGDQCRIIQ
jgi:hypothetical protein